MSSFVDSIVIHLLLLRHLAPASQEKDRTDMKSEQELVAPDKKLQLQEQQAILVQARLVLRTVVTFQVGSLDGSLAGYSYRH